MYKFYLYVMYKQKRETKKLILREQKKQQKIDKISHCLSLLFLFVQTEACEKGFRSNSFFQA